MQLLEPSVLYVNEWTVFVLFSGQIRQSLDENAQPLCVNV